MPDIQELSDKQLHDLCERQLEHMRKARSEIYELDRLLEESLGEFHRRCHEGQEVADA